MSADQQVCKEWVRPDGWGSGHECGNPAKAEREGKWVCGIHRAAFDRVKKNAEERRANRLASEASKAFAQTVCARLAGLGVRDSIPDFSTFTGRHTGWVVVDGQALTELLDRLEARENRP